MSGSRSGPVITEDPATWIRPIRYVASSYGQMMHLAAGSPEDLQQELWVEMLKVQRDGGVASLIEQGTVWIFLRRRAIEHIRKKLGRPGWRLQRDRMGVIHPMDIGQAHGELRPLWGKATTSEPDEWVDVVALAEFVAMLTPMERDIIDRRASGHTMAQIGVAYGVSESRICQRVAAVRRKHAAWADAG